MKNMVLLLPLILFLSCNTRIDLNGDLKGGHVGSTTGGPSGGATSGGSGDGNLLYSDTFPVDGQLDSPWDITIAGNPIPTVNSGVLSSHSAESAQVATIFSGNTYSEIEFQFTSAPVAYGTFFALPLRHSLAPHVVFCQFMVSSNILMVQFFVFNWEGDSSSVPIATSISDTDLTLHKAACSVETSGADIIMKAYIDPSSSSTTPVASYTFIGAEAIAPSGSAGIVLEGNNTLNLDNFSVYQAFPY